MKAFLTPLQGLAEFEQICEKGKKNKGVLQVSGCLESQKAHLIYGLCQLAPFRLILAEDERRAREIYEDYRFYDKDIFISCQGSAFLSGRHSRESVDPPENAGGTCAYGGKGASCCYQY